MTEDKKLFKIIGLFGIFCCPLSSLPVFAEDSAPAVVIEKPVLVESAPTFSIVEFIVEGNTLLDQALIKAELNKFTGPDRNFGDVQEALESLQKLYQKNGFGAVQVVLPEQELKQGQVLFKVMEQKIGLVKIDGAQHHNEANILNSMPSLAVGEIPSTKRIAANLRVANENPSKQTTVLFRSSETDASQVDAVVRVVDERPYKYFATLDNTGNQQTGNGRIGLGFQHYNLMNQDDRLSAQVVTSPESLLDDVKIFGVGYSHPLYRYGDSVDFIYGYSDVNAGNILNGALNIASKGFITGAHYNFNLRKWGDLEHKWVFGLDYKRFKPDTTTEDGLNQTPHASTTPLSITYFGSLEKKDWLFGFNAGVSHNLAIGKNGGRNSLGINDDAAFPWLTDVHFTKFNAGGNVSHTVFGNWTAHANFSMQWTDDHLHPGEQFGVGGMTTVRGWKERSYAGDKGYLLSLELTSPDFGAKLNDKLSARSVLFYDQGLEDNNANILGIKDDSAKRIVVSSIGAGLRVNFNKQLLGRVDYAYVLDGETRSSLSSDTKREPGDMFGHVSLVWMW